MVLLLWLLLFVLWVREVEDGEEMIKFRSLFAGFCCVPRLLGGVWKRIGPGILAGGDANEDVV